MTAWTGIRSRSSLASFNIQSSESSPLSLSGLWGAPLIKSIFGVFDCGFADQSGAMPLANRSADTRTPELYRLLKMPVLGRLARLLLPLGHPEGRPPIKTPMFLE
jgi:hypothetical protein